MLQFWESLMPNQILRDEQGHVLGMMEMTPGGIVDARDPNGGYIGSYDLQSNITRDSKCHALGTGNLLASLISL